MEGKANMTTEKPPKIKTKDGITRCSTGAIIGKMVQFTDEVFEYANFLNRILKDNGFKIIEHSLAHYKNKRDKDGWVETFGNYEDMAEGFYPGTFEYLKKRISKDFGFTIQIRFWKIERKYLRKIPRWELIYNYNYPLQFKMDELLKDWKDINAIAIDGEEYSGVLLCGGEERLPLNQLNYILSAKLSRVKELWDFLDEEI